MDREERKQWGFRIPELLEELKGALTCQDHGNHVRRGTTGGEEGYGVRLPLQSFCKGKLITSDTGSHL